MKRWTSQSLFQDDGAPADITAVAEALYDDLDLDPEAPGHPRILSFGRHDGDEDVCRFEIVTELAAGVVIATTYGSREGLEEGSEQEGEDDVDDAVSGVHEAVDACMPHVGRFSDLVHEARRRARMAMAEWQADGLQVRLVDVRLAPYDHWRGATDPLLVVLIEALDQRLSLQTFEVHADGLDTLEQELATERHQLEQRHADWLELSRNGANGWIDQLSLNAIAQFGDVATTLRRFASEWRIWVPDATCLLMRNGDVTAGNGTGDPAVHWGRDVIVVQGLKLSRQMSAAAVGRSVTEIFQHPFVSSDMTVLDVSTETQNGRVATVIKLAMPRRLFCSVTGRVWDERPPEQSSADGAKVIPFRSRAR